MASNTSAAAEKSTVAELLANASATIPRREAELLLEHVSERSRTWLFMHDDAPIRSAFAERFMALVERRAAGEPVAYLTGHRGFWSMKLAVSPATLIPRSETELLIELALHCLPAGARVLDLGTGSGAIALAIAKERPDAHVIAIDRSAEALDVARGNAKSLALGNVEFRHGDWFAPVRDLRFDCIVSNPPYIEDADPHLRQGDLRFEPLTALASGIDGLDDLRRIVAAAPLHLQPKGRLFVEHGWQQGAAVQVLFYAAGFAHVETHRDMEARERVTDGTHRCL